MSSKSGSRRIAQRYPYSSTCVEVSVPVSAAADASSSCVSFITDSKSAVPSGWKTRPAAPREVIPSPVSSCTYAVDIANSRSGAGPLSLRRPPSSASKKPNLGGDLELALVLHEPLDALLHRRMRHEQRLDRPLDAR